MIELVGKLCPSRFYFVYIEHSNQLLVSNWRERRAFFTSSKGGGTVLAREPNPGGAVVPTQSSLTCAAVLWLVTNQAVISLRISTTDLHVSFTGRPSGRYPLCYCWLADCMQAANKGKVSLHKNSRTVVGQDKNARKSIAVFWWWQDHW